MATIAKGGKRAKKKKRMITNSTRGMQYIAQDGSQVYGIVEKRSGGNFIEILCSDQKVRKGFIRGKIRKRDWMKEGSIVMCSLGTFGTSEKDKDKCNIELVYKPEEVRILESQGLLNFKKDIAEDIFENDNIIKNESENNDIIIKPQENQEIFDDDLYGGTEGINIFNEGSNTNDALNEQLMQDLIDML